MLELLLWVHRHTYLLIMKLRIKCNIIKFRYLYCYILLNFDICIVIQNVNLNVRPFELWLYFMIVIFRVATVLTICTLFVCSWYRMSIRLRYHVERIFTKARDTRKKHFVSVGLPYFTWSIKIYFVFYLKYKDSQLVSVYTFAIM